MPYSPVRLGSRQDSLSMPPLPLLSHPLPRVITYYQTHHDSQGRPISILPLVSQAGSSVTHVIVAAVHINQDPQQITLNDHQPSDPRFQTLWAELRVLQASGVKVMAMLGGAAQGTYMRLDQSQEQFETYYGPVRDMIRERGLDGIDLDVEEEMSLGGIVRLIDRLRRDFGREFIISMAPVAAALLDFTKNLSGFDYEALEVMRGGDIAWYNCQFYYGWGDITSTLMYDMMIRKGWRPEKVVVGVVTSPENGGGFVPQDMLAMVLLALHQRHGRRFGGVMGWEFFNSLPGGRERPWEWAMNMSSMLRETFVSPLPQQQSEQAEILETEMTVEIEIEIDPDSQAQGKIRLPEQFDYFSDGIDD